MLLNSHSTATEGVDKKSDSASSFDVPDRALWERGYAAEAGRSPLPLARTLDDALGIIQPFLDPLLDGSARGAWDPTKPTLERLTRTSSRHEMLYGMEQRISLITAKADRSRACGRDTSRWHRFPVLGD